MLKEKCTVYAYKIVNSDLWFPYSGCYECRLNTLDNKLTRRNIVFFLAKCFIILTSNTFKIWRLVRAQRIYEIHLMTGFSTSVLPRRYWSSSWKTYISEWYKYISISKRKENRGILRKYKQSEASLLMSQLHQMSWVFPFNLMYKIYLHKFTAVKE